MRHLDSKVAVGEELNRLYGLLKGVHSVLSVILLFKLTSLDCHIDITQHIFKVLATSTQKVAMTAGALEGRVSGVAYLGHIGCSDQHAQHKNSWKH